MQPAERASERAFERATEQPFGLDAMAWPEVVPLGANKPTLLIPVGSTEQHGPHLPIGTDTMIAVAVARNTAKVVHGQEQSALVYVAPAISFTASGEHEGFPGTISIGTEVFQSVLIELVRSASTWCGQIVFVNGHGGNADAFRNASQVWKEEGRDVTVWSPSLPDGGDWHAGWVETSVMLALHPELVGEVREPGELAQNADVKAKLRASGVLGVSISGVLGDPTLATVSAGQKLFAEWTASLEKQIRFGSF